MTIQVNFPTVASDGIDISPDILDKLCVELINSMSFLLPLFVLFIPSALLFYMATEIYQRNPRSRQHRITMLLVASISLLFLGEFFIHAIPEALAPLSSRYVKLPAAFLLMTCSLHFMHAFAA